MSSRALEESSGHSEGGGHEEELFKYDETGGAWFLMITLLIGICVRLMTKFIPIPYTVALLLIGLAIGAIEAHGSGYLGAVGDSISLWTNLDPHTILTIFLPALIFGSAAAVDWHVFNKEIFQMMLLAVPGVIMSALLTAVVAVYVMYPEWSLSTGITFGAMLSATDPVAVVALLHELGAAKQLALLIEGESLFNDGSALVVFIVFLDFMAGQEPVRTAGETVGFFMRLALGGVAFGWLMGEIMVKVLKASRLDIMTQITVTVVCAYFTFIVAENEAIHVSGVLAVVCAGLVMAAHGFQHVRHRETLKHFWETVEYLANTVIFIVSGVIIYVKGFASFGSGEEGAIDAYDIAMLFVLYIALMVIRTLVMFILWPFLRQMGYSFSAKFLIVISYSGLRGAVGLVLAIIVENDPRISSEISGRFLFHMAGIALLTLTVNGTTTGMLLSCLGLSGASPARARMLNKAIRRLVEVKQRSDLFSQAQYQHAEEDRIRTFMRDIFEELEAYTEKVRHLASQPVGGHHLSGCTGCLFRALGCQTFLEILDEDEKAVEQRAAEARKAGSFECVPRCLKCIVDVQDICDCARPRERDRLVCCPKSCLGLIGPWFDSCPCCFEVSGYTNRAGEHVGEEFLQRSAEREAREELEAQQQAREALERQRRQDEQDRARMGVPGLPPMNRRMVSVTSDPQLMPVGGLVAAVPTHSHSFSYQPEAMANHEEEAAVYDKMLPGHAYKTQLERGRTLPSVQEADYEGETMEGAEGAHVMGEQELDSLGDGDGDVIGGNKSRKGGRVAVGTARSRNASGGSTGSVLPPGSPGRRGSGGSAFGSPTRSRKPFSPTDGKSAGGTGAEDEQFRKATDSGKVMVRTQTEMCMANAQMQRDGGESRTPTPVMEGDATVEQMMEESEDIAGMHAGAGGGCTLMGCLCACVSPFCCQRRTPEEIARSKADFVPAEMEMRYRVLNIVRQRYQRYFDDGQMSASAYDILIDALNKSLDRVQDPLGEWVRVKRYASYDLSLLLSRFSCVPDALNFNALKLEYDLSVNFMRGHEKVEDALAVLLSDLQRDDPDTWVKVVGECRRQYKLASDNFTSMCSLLPVLRAVQTDHAMSYLVRLMEREADRILAAGDIVEDEHEVLVETLREAWHRADNVRTVQLEPQEELRRVGYFKHLQKEHFRTISKEAEFIFYEPGDVLLQEGQRAPGFFVLMSGQLGIHARLTEEEKREERAAKEQEQHQQASLKAGGYGDSDTIHRTNTGTVIGHSSSKDYHSSAALAAGHPKRAVSALDPDVDVSRLAMHNVRAGSKSSSLGASSAGSGKSADATDGGGSSVGTGSKRTTSPQTIQAKRDDSHTALTVHYSRTTVEDRLRKKLDLPLPMKTGEFRSMMIEENATPADLFGPHRDNLTSGNLVGVVSMLTGTPAVVTAIAKTRCYVAWLPAKKIWRQLKSEPPSDPAVPLRRVTPLENTICKMAGLLVAETGQIRVFSKLKRSVRNKLFKRAMLVRPEFRQPVKIEGDILLLTGRIERPKDKLLGLWIATHLENYQPGMVFSPQKQSSHPTRVGLEGRSLEHGMAYVHDTHPGAVGTSGAAAASTPGTGRTSRNGSIDEKSGAPPATPDARPLRSTSGDLMSPRLESSDLPYSGITAADQALLNRNALLTPALTQRDISLVCNEAELHASSQVVVPRQRLTHRAAPVTSSKAMTNSQRAHQALRLTRRFLQPDDEIPMSVAMAVAKGEFACGGEKGLNDTDSVVSFGSTPRGAQAVPQKVLEVMLQGLQLGRGHGRTDSAMSTLTEGSERPDSPRVNFVSDGIDGDEAARREALAQSGRLGAAEMAMMTSQRAGPKLHRQRSRALVLGFDSSKQEQGPSPSRLDAEPAGNGLEMPVFGGAVGAPGMMRGVSAPHADRRRQLDSSAADAAGAASGGAAGAAASHIPGHAALADVDDVAVQLHDKPALPQRAFRSKTEGGQHQRSAQDDLIGLQRANGGNRQSIGPRAGPNAHDIDDFDPDYHAKNQDDAESVTYQCHVGNTVVSKTLEPRDFDTKYSPFQFVPYTHTRGRFLWFSAHARILVFPKGMVARELQRVDAEAKRHAREVRRQRIGQAEGEGAMNLRDVVHTVMAEKKLHEAAGLTSRPSASERDIEDCEDVAAKCDGDECVDQCALDDTMGGSAMPDGLPATTSTPAGTVGAQGAAGGARGTPGGLRIRSPPKSKPVGGIQLPGRKGGAAESNFIRASRMDSDVMMAMGVLAQYRRLPPAAARSATGGGTRVASFRDDALAPGSKVAARGRSKLGPRD